jgi:hypothetical protein
MGLVTFVVLVAALIVLVLTLRAAVDGTPSLMSGLGGYRELGWPAGVQEDDDLHWSWAGQAARPRRAAPTLVRVVAPVDDGWERPPALEVQPTPLRSEVRPLDGVKS